MHKKITGASVGYEFFIVHVRTWMMINAYDELHQLHWPHNYIPLSCRMDQDTIIL